MSTVTTTFCNTHFYVLGGIYSALCRYRPWSESVLEASDFWHSGPVLHPTIASSPDSSDYVVCPWSLLLSASGSLSFQDHVSHIEAAPFKAPELLRGPNEDEQPEASQVECMAPRLQYPGESLSWGETPQTPCPASVLRLKACSLRAFLPAIYQLLDKAVRLP